MAGNKKQNKRWMAGFLAILTAFSAFFWHPMDIHAEETDLFGETILLEGIELNRTSLVMKTGEQASLRANLFPENTTEQPEMIWSVCRWIFCSLQSAGDGAGAHAREYHLYAEQFRKQPL